MKRFYERAMACALFVLAAAPAYAATEVDLSGLWTNLLAYVAVGVGAIVSAVVTWGTLTINKMGLIKIEDSRRDSLKVTLENGAALAIQKAGSLLPGSVTIDNQFIAAGVSYVIANAPDALAYFKLQPDDIRVKVEAAVTKLLVPSATSV